MLNLFSKPENKTQFKIFHLHLRKSHQNSEFNETALYPHLAAKRNGKIFFPTVKPIIFQRGIRW